MKLTIRTLKRLIKEAVQEATQTPNESNVVEITPDSVGGKALRSVARGMDDDVVNREIYKLVKKSGAQFVYEDSMSDMLGPDGIVWNSSEHGEVLVTPTADWLADNDYSFNASDGRPH